MNIIYFLAEAIKIKPGEVPNMPTHSAADILANVLYMAYFIAGALAVIVIVLAGYTFATSVYDPQKVAQAKNAIIYASIGLIVIGLAFGVTQFVMQRF